MVVLLIIGIIAVVVIPRIATLGGVELNSTARSLVGTIRITYSTAVVKKKPYRLAFDLTQQAYWVEEKSGDEYIKPTDSLLGPRVIPETIYISQVAILDRDCVANCVEYLYFSPGGYVEEAAIQLATLDGEQVVSVFTLPMTGRAVIVPGNVSRADWEKGENQP